MPAPSLQALWPVDSIYISAGNTSPAVLFGFGTWVAFGIGRVLVGIDPGQAEFDTLLETGGAKDITLTAAQMPSHTHVQDAHSHTQRHFPTATGASTGQTVDTSMSGTQTNSTVTTASATAVNQSTGGDQAHPNLPPYIVVRMWRRTA